MKEKRKKEESHLEHVEMYSVRSICENCDYRDLVLIPMGTTVADYFSAKRCPLCGCFTLVKD